MAPQSYLIGIAGPSGAGKSFLAQHLAERLRAPVLALDRYYRDLSHLLPDARANVNFDEPAALEHELLIAHLRDLREGRGVAVPTYDFSIHTRTAETWSLAPSPVVVLEGLFTLYWPELRELLDTTVYVELDESMCLQRRLERDVQERGRTPESVIVQFRGTVAPMAERYVLPSRHHADVLISGSMPIDDGVGRILQHVLQQARREQMKFVLDALSPLEPAPAQ